MFFFYSSIGEGSVATLICCEFLSDVHRLCEVDSPTKNRQLEQLTKQTELEVIQDYLANGRGWRCLAVLQLFNLRELTCARELIGFLIALYPLLSLFDENPELKNAYLRLQKFHNEDHAPDGLDYGTEPAKKKKRRKKINGTFIFIFLILRNA